MSKDEPLNVIIPLGGLGKRFAEEGFIQPKPFIKVLGKSIIDWVLECLDLSSQDHLYIIYHSSLGKVNFEEVVKHKFPNVSFTKLLSDTRGAAETVYKCAESLPKDRLNYKTICLDGDTFYTIDIINQIRNTNGSGVVCFPDNQDKPIYSYVETNSKGEIVKIAEKIKISDYANTGCYFFESAKIMMEYCSVTISEGKKDKGEFYISSVLGRMLSDKINLIAKKIADTDFVVLGTPYQVKLFAGYNIKETEKIRFCFDIDNTILTYPKKIGDYSTCLPIRHNVDILRFLKSLGHTIILYTARRMKTHSGNVGSVVKDVGMITMDSLKKYEIPYDEIYFGKPYAHFYIDDLAINTSSNIEKEIGFYKSEISERSFNTLKQSSLETITKNSNNKTALLGEIYWYENMPDEVKKLFPRYFGKNNMGFEIEKVRGVSLSHMYLDGLMTKMMLKNLITSIEKIHSCEITKNNLDVNIYANYSNKIKNRYENFDYSAFNESEIKYKNILKDLKEYEENKNGEISVIHGDPVFTNIIVKENQDFVFIDMRGEIGGQQSICGDKWYDYAKIYQSLIGYDEILLEKFIDTDYKSSLIKFFEEMIIEKFGEERMGLIKSLTSSLFFSLMPLHDENHKIRQYFELI